MKKVLSRVLILFIINVLSGSCGITKKDIDPGMKFFFYETEHYTGLLRLPEKAVRKLVPEKFDLEKNVLCRIQISRYKKVYLPADGSPFNAFTVSLLVKYKEFQAWFPLAALVNIPPFNIQPMFKFGYQNRLGIIEYVPAGTSFRASVKRDFSLFLEMEFTFLPRETFEMTADKQTAIQTAEIYMNQGKIILLENTYSENKPETVQKDGVGACIFHPSPDWNEKLLNNTRLETIFFTEIKGHVYKRAYILE